MCRAQKGHRRLPDILHRAQPLESGGNTRRVFALMDPRLVVIAQGKSPHQRKGDGGGQVSLSSGRE